MIDNNRLEMEAMAMFKTGDMEKARQLQNTFLEEVRNSGEDHCSCPVPCEHHGHCVDCVVMHRGHGDHLPHCFREMVNKRLAALSALTEHSVQAQSGNGD